MNSSTSASTTRRVFYDPWRVPAMIIALVLIGLTVTIWTTYGVNVGALLLLLVCLGYMHQILCDALYGRVVITTDGIEFRRMGYCIQTRWDNIKRLVYAQIGQSKGDILVLREPRVSVNKRLSLLWREAQRLERAKEFAPLGKAMPLYYLDQKWRTGELGQELRRHAPHLFTDYEK